MHTKPDPAVLAVNAIRAHRAQIIVALVFVALFFAFRTGLVRELQNSIADQAWGRAQFAIGAALTSMKHGGYGYTIGAPVKSVLENGGLTGDPALLKRLGVTFPDNLRNPMLINRAISQAAQSQGFVFRDLGVSGVGGDDVGMIDFVRLSFLLFGLKLASFYLTYFVLVGLSFGCAVLAFREQPGVLAVFGVLGLAFALLFGSSVLSPEVDGILDPRFLSTLGIVPAMHVAMALITRLPWTPKMLALAAAQCLLLAFTCWIRTSALWMLLAIFLLAAGLAIWRRRQSRSELRHLWPAGMLLAVVLAYLSAVTFALHPIYKRGAERAYHGIWHAMLYALQFHPEWNAKYAAQYDNARYDEMPDAVAKKYLLRHPPKDPSAVYLTADRGYLRPDVSERYKREALFEFLATDPRLVIEAYLVTNVKLSVQSFSHHLGSLKRLPAAAKYGAAVLLLALALLLFSDRAAMTHVLQGSAVLTLGFLVSLSYLVISAPSVLVVADQVLLLIAIGGAWTMLALCHAAARIPR